MSDYTIDEIRHIVNDCEEYCQSDASTYSKEQEMKAAYLMIVRALRLDSTTDDGR